MIVWLFIAFGLGGLTASCIDRLVWKHARWKEDARAAIWGVLENGSMYGREIKDAVRDRFGINVEYQCYALLRDLERQGHIRSWEESTLITPPEILKSRGGRPRRKYERINRVLPSAKAVLQ